MQHTYEAILNGNQVNWTGNAPEQKHPLRVQITVLEETPDDHTRGETMAQALTLLAQKGTFSAVEDPVAWQRQSRQDRSLPGRTARAS